MGYPRVKWKPLGSAEFSSVPQFFEINGRSSVNDVVCPGNASDKYKRHVPLACITLRQGSCGELWLWLDKSDDVRCLLGSS
jgi:hypothetical protein